MYWSSDVCTSDLVRLHGAVARLQHVARPADGQADIAVGQRVDVLRGVELLDVGPDRHQNVFGLGDDVGIVAVGILADVVERGGNEFVRRVQQVNAAVGELGNHVRVEDYVPGVDGRVGHALLDLVLVVADAGC